MNGIPASVAGTQAYDAGKGVAVLGKIVTAARCRGKGLCQATVSYLMREPRKRGVRHIGLHVETSNAPAISAYRNIGFRIHPRLTQYDAFR